MKIEKISDNQIRCTLSRDDLVDRELRISELAYGSEKAKALFRDMMQQANYEFGFEAEDIPLMIEAIPISPECLILVITKVEDPDELDTRFSKFSPDANSEEDAFDSNMEDDSYADEILNSFGQMDELLVDSGDDNKEEFVPLVEALSPNAEVEQGESSSQKSVSIQTNLLKVYSFHSLNEVIKLSSILCPYYKGINSLYKNPVDSIYYLVISKSDHTPEEFNKICNIASEYGKPERTTYASPHYYQEHFEIIVKDSAIQILSVM